jgi:hypothetical protein
MLADAALDNELLRMTDAYTDELFPLTPFEAGRVVFPVSRLVCDVEPLLSDEDEPMAARGMGAFYTRTSMGMLLRAQSNPAARQLLLDRWYWPHHSKLERMVDDVRRLGLPPNSEFRPMQCVFPLILSGGVQLTTKIARVGVGCGQPNPIRRSAICSRSRKAAGQVARDLRHQAVTWHLLGRRRQAAGRIAGDRPFTQAGLPDRRFAI